ncbi:MAG: hypothetical protein ACK2UK_12795 [Candidatus Promineifilaceae bacterium]
MSLPKRYHPRTREPELLAAWEEAGTYHSSRDSRDPFFSIDTPPAGN